jgi:hypothetical protein
MWGMQSLMLLSGEEVAECAENLYNERIRQEIEREENIGKMVIIDIETGEYEVDKTGLEAVKHLRKKILMVDSLGFGLATRSQLRSVVSWSGSKRDFWSGIQRSDSHRQNHSVEILVISTLFIGIKC